MAHVLLSIGSNIEPEKNVELCKDSLRGIEKTENWIFSGYYYSLPEGFDSSNKFINIIAYCQCEYGPESFLSELQAIEENLGRVEKSKNFTFADRVIDIDIILWDKLQLHTKRLVIPHPKWKTRHFVMNPLRDMLSKHGFIRSFFKI